MFEALKHLHANGRLHQSLGPSSLVLSTIRERNAAPLAVRLRDLAFSVDVTNEALVGGATLAELYESTSKTRSARPECVTCGSNLLLAGVGSACCESSVVSTGRCVQ